jgi:hypothetical protein
MRVFGQLAGQRPDMLRHLPIAPNGATAFLIIMA